MGMSSASSVSLISLSAAQEIRAIQIITWLLDIREGEDALSVTGLKTNNLYASMKFWLLTIPAFREAQKAEGILLCENKSRNGYQHTLTVWKTKAHMLAYLRSPKHMKAMRAFPSIAIGRLLSYESDAVPSWDEALLKWEREARHG